MGGDCDWSVVDGNGVKWCGNKNAMHAHDTLNHITLQFNVNVGRRVMENGHGNKVDDANDNDVGEMVSWLCALWSQWCAADAAQETT